MMIKNLMNLLDYLKLDEQKNLVIHLEPLEAVYQFLFLVDCYVKDHFLVIFGLS